MSEQTQHYRNENENKNDIVETGHAYASSSSSSSTASLLLFERVEAALHAEARLTGVIDRVRPWLLPPPLQPRTLVDSDSSPPQHPHTIQKSRHPLRHHQNRNRHTTVRVRPMPAHRHAAEHVLAYARMLSTRSSAPAGWNPQAAAPLMMGFSTPNPLPHQLRGGALAALQLDRARAYYHNQQEQQAKKKQKRIIEEKEKEKEHPSTSSRSDTAKAAAASSDAKRLDVWTHRPSEAASTTTTITTATTNAPVQLSQPQQRLLVQQPPSLARRPQDFSMNLSSDSSSSSNSSEDED